MADPNPLEKPEIKANNDATQNLSFKQIQEGFHDLKEKSKDIAESLSEKGITESLKDMKTEMEIQSLSEINTFYQGQVENIDEGKALEDQNTIKESSIEDIRFNTRLLVPKEENESLEKTVSNIKTETAKRMKAYTSEEKGGWFTLNYNQYGYEHERNIGLGDILLDPSIKKIAVIKDGKNYIVERGLVKNRPCFVYPDGRYVATFTGDKFRILTNEEILDQEKFMEEFNKEEELRKKDKEDFKIEKHSTNHNTADVAEAVTKYTGEYSTDEWITNNINKNREEKDGLEILNHAKLCAEKFDIPWDIYRELIYMESSWNPVAKNPHSSAEGLGQFLDGTWSDFLSAYNNDKTDNKELIEGQKISKTNPYVMAYATAYLMKKTKDSYEGLDSKPIYEQAIVYYLAHHEGRGGVKTYLAFLDEMKVNNAFTKNEMAKEFHENKEKYLALLGTEQVKRLNESGIDSFLKIYFKYAKDVVAVRASKSNETAQNQAKEEYNKKLSEEMSIFSSATVETLDSSPKQKQGNYSLPYRTQFSSIKIKTEKGENIVTSYSSGYPGYIEGESTFDEEIARSQIKNLKSKGVTRIISLAQDEPKIGKEAWKKYQQILKDEGIYQTTNLFITTNIVNNHKVFEEIGSMIKNGETILVHCRNNAHRAPTAIAGAWLASGACSDFETALQYAGITTQDELNKFKYNDKSKIYFKSLLEYAKLKNIPINGNYSDIV